MEVRITFRSEVYVTADNIKEAREKFESMNLLGNNNVEGVTSPEFVEMVSVEDADTYKDLWMEYYH